MMMIPRRNHDMGVLGDLFDDPFFTDDESKVMKTDIKEKKDKYELFIDLPGYKKENIKMSIEDGYLNIEAKADKEHEEHKDGQFIRKERYVGSCSRSFYVGDNIKEEDIKASFKNGTLEVDIPKKDEPKDLPNKHYIEIDD